MFMRFWVTTNGQRLTELYLKLHKGLACNEGSNLLMEDMQTVATVLEINTRISNQKFEVFKGGLDFWGEIHENKAEGFLYLNLNKYFPTGVVRPGLKCTLGPFYWTAEVK